MLFAGLPAGEGMGQGFRGEQDGHGAGRHGDGDGAGGFLAVALPGGHGGEGGVDAEGEGFLLKAPGEGFHGGVGDHKHGFAVPVAQAPLQDQFYDASLHGNGGL